MISAFKKPLIFPLGIFIISLCNFVYFIIFYLKFGYLPNPFIFDKNNTFMDFYNPLYWSINNTQYTLFNSIYPPLNFIFLNFTCYIFPCENTTDSFLFRQFNGNINYLIVLLFYFSLLISFLSFNLKSMKLRRLDAVLLFLAFAISPPVLFALERGNTLFIAIPLISIYLNLNKNIFKYVFFALFVNIKPYLLLLTLSNFNIHAFRIKNIIYLGFLALFIFFISSLLFDINYIKYFSNYFIFASKFPPKVTEILSLPFSLSALSSLRNLSPGFHHYSAILFLPAILNSVTVFILIFVMLAKKLTNNELILSSFLVTANFSSILGGYTYLLYIPFFPLLFQEERRKEYLIILSCIYFLPLDFIRIVNLHELYIDSYLSQRIIGQVNQYLTLGTFVRPILNYSLLAIFTFSKCKKYGLTTHVITNSRAFKYIHALINNSGRVNKFALFMSLACILLYNYLFSFSYLPITEGWFLAYAKLITNGAMPYKDFLLYLTPLYPLTIAFFIFIFGDGLFAQRILGVFVILGISSILFLLLNRKFSPPSSFAATVIAIIYYQSGVAHITYDFTQFLTLAIITTIFFLANTVRDLAATNSQRKIFSVCINLYLSCFFSSISFLIKQSNGAFIVIFTALSLLFVLFHSKNIKIKFFLASVLGFLTPVFVIFIWLAWNDSIGFFWSQIFTGAIAAKGSLAPIAFAWISRLLSEDLMIKSFKLFILLVILIIFHYAATYKKTILPKYSCRPEFNFTILTAYFFIISTFIIISFASPSAKLIVKFSGLGSRVGSYALAASVLFIFLFFASKKFKFLEALSSDPTLTIMVTMSLGMIWGNGTSAGVGEIAVFILVAIIVAQLLEIRNLSFLWQITIIALLAAFITNLCIAKFNTPYYWWGLKQQNVHEANYQVNANIGSKFRISKESASILEALDKAIPSNSGGDIFAFPNIPIVYLISNRWPQSKILVQWFDFLPDSAAIEEADRLLQKPPETIVNLNLPNNVWDAHESLFRGGEKSGQRSIQRAIATLTSDMALYTLTFSTEVSDGYKLDVWNLKNAR